jgi:hypothetical protein
MSDRVDRDSGSFRDPEGFVFRLGRRVFRALKPSGLDSYRAFRDSGAAEWAEQQGFVVRSWEVEQAAQAGLGHLPADVVAVLEQERIPFISYPYEWTFDMLKDAALLQLTLSCGVARYRLTVKDATAYNIQFAGGKPIFIDVLSFQRYQEGMPWMGYAQFCQSFFYPLALQAFCRVDFQPMSRSYLDGIPLATAKQILGLRVWLHWSVFKHVLLQAVLQKSFGKEMPVLAEEFKTLRFSLDHSVRLMRALKGQVAKLSLHRTVSPWSSYRDDNSYSARARERKRAFITKHLEKIAPANVWDIGCNTGEFSLLAADYSPQVIAFDSDADSVNRLYLHCKAHGITRILPLVSDLANPSPALGWKLEERQSLLERGRVECILALALIHHLCLTRNIPVAHIFSLFAGLGVRHVLIEFVPKTDPMVKHLLKNRDDVYPWYNQSDFEKEATSLFSIGERMELENGGRVMYWLIRRVET